MAQSRLEKIGTIYSRVAGLLQSKSLAREDRPLWYDIYEAFPPKEEPRFDRPAPNTPLRNIFYPEDKIRAVFQKNNKVGLINMFDNTHKTSTQKFIDQYNSIKEQYGESSSEEHIYQEALDLFQRDKETATQEESSKLRTEFLEAQSKSKPTVNVNVSDVFKE